VIDTETGKTIDATMIDPETGMQLTHPRFQTAPGPAANEKTRNRYAFANSDARRVP